MRTTIPNTNYRTNVRPLPDNNYSGYGPSYSSDSKGPYFLCYVANCFAPAVYAIRTASLEEAYEHALETIATPIADADLADLDLDGDDPYGELESVGATFTESGQMVHADDVRVIGPIGRPEFY